ncbi:MAG: glycosyltransferase family 39 protein, partial [Gammaproteobacteria bacterium]|nr:glycosyltransferase family 39 protein [Gammaproteobacteria bacterium]
PFLLDDVDVLSALGKFGGVTDWDTFRAFVFGGQAGPTGRPLALLTYLLDGNDWPADSWPFKRTNLLIHLANGVLLGMLISVVLDLLAYDKRDARAIALVSVAAWLLHPFLVSTTLYVAQRMAQLAALFVFAGLVSYLYGRSLLARDKTKAYLVMSLSIGLFTPLAVLSKENGVLLPTLVGVIELTIVASQRQRLPALNRYWTLLFIVLPSALVVLYMATNAIRSDFFGIVPPRDFSVYERVLTQPRILVDYLRHWFIPELYTSGVFQDHFVKSTGIFSPISTLLAVILHCTVIAVALIYRRRWTLFAFAVLFFYVGHLLESTVLYLELYFEHRNYLPAAFLFVPLVAALHRSVSRETFLLVAASVLLVLGGFTRYSASVWTSFPAIVEASARTAPTSARAQAQYATLLFNAGRYDESVAVIERAIQNAPGEHPLLLINRLIILCNLGALTSDELDRVGATLGGAIYDPRSIKMYAGLTAAVQEGRCPDVATSALHRMFLAMLEVPANADPQSLGYSHLQYFVGLTEIYAGRPSRAVLAFEKSLQAEPGAEHAMAMAARLATAEYFAEALRFADKALASLQAERRGTLQPPSVKESDIRAFQANIRTQQDEARRGHGADESRP